MIIYLLLIFHILYKLHALVQFIIFPPPPPYFETQM
jgi:hypothetical protein